MSSNILNIDRNIELNGNRISYRNLPSYHFSMHDHNAVQILIPLENSHYEITWALEAKETESKLLGAADISLIPPLLEHEVRWTNCANFINVYITPKFIHDHIDEHFDVQDNIFEAEIGIEDRFIYHLGHSIRSHFLKHQDDNNYKYLDSVLTVLSQHLVDNYIKSNTEPVLFNDLSQLPCEKIREAILYMYNNLDRNLSVEEIADSVGMSHYHFTRVFREMIGMPPAKFHTQQRIDKAKELLSTHRQIIDVANELGFSSQSHFSNVFTKSVGITPRKFMMQGGQY